MSSPSNANDDMDFEFAPGRNRPSTVTVLGLMTMAAFILSYLAAYAVSDALVAADIMRPWPRDTDPRPRWMACWLGGVLCTLALMAVASRWMSHRHLKHIDAMGDVDDDLL